MVEGGKSRDSFLQLSWPNTLHCKSSNTDPRYLKITPLVDPFVRSTALLNSMYLIIRRSLLSRSNYNIFAAFLT